MKTNEPSREVKHVSLIVALVVTAMLALSACSDETTQPSGGDDAGPGFVVACTDDSDCFPDQICDQDLGGCIGAPPNPPRDEPTPPPPEDSGPPDMGTDQPQPDTAADVPEETTDSEEDVEDTGTDIVNDLADEPDTGTDAPTDLSDADTLIDAPDDIELDVPPVICPFDHLETGTPNNSFLTPSQLHDGTVAGTIGARSVVDRERLLCGDRAFTDRLVTSSCTDDGVDCECELFSNLGACGNADPDYHRFYLVPGDTAYVRVMFETPYTADLINAALILPPTEETCPTDTCDSGFGCFNGLCHPVTNVESAADDNWVDTNDDGIDDAIELVVPEVPGADSARVPHWLRVNSQTEAEYSVLVQVEPTGRSCLHDSWDDDWDTYSASAEAGCGGDTDCELQATTDDTPAPGYATLCAWDLQDYFTHVVDEAGGAQRQIDVSWDHHSPATVTAEISGGFGTKTIEKHGPGLLRMIFCGNDEPLPQGTYNLEVTSDLAVEVDVFFYTTVTNPLFNCPDPG